ncbi:ABC transporter ATP-binding protein, partial [bacterium]|nr:ABC transporter ATP-binding protein [bacterium]
IECIEVAGLKDLMHAKSSALPVEKRRRLDLCRTLALKPKIIMLDECLAGLNPREMEEGLGLIRMLNSRGIAIIFIEHVMKAVCSLCHRLVVLNQGELLVEGAPEDVMKNKKVIAAYLGEKYVHAGN